MADDERDERSKSGRASSSGDSSGHRRDASSRSSGPAKRPYTPRDGAAKRPYTPRDGGEKRPYAPRDGVDKRPYTPRDGGEKRPYAPRDGAAKRPYAPRDGVDKRPYTPRDGGDKRPYAPRDGAAKRPYTPRDGGDKRPYTPRDGGDKRPYAPRDGGDKRPYAPRDGAAKRPYAPRDGGDKRPYAPRDGGDKRPYAPRDGGDKRPYTPRDGGDTRPYARRDDSRSTASRPPQDTERRTFDEPFIPEDVTARDLNGSARNELKTLSKENAEQVARHLAMAAQLIDDDPALAHRHALAASHRAGRIAIVRETVAITAYANEDFALALRELRTYRRISGKDDQIALMVDSERGVGRADRAIEVGRAVDRSALATGVRVELAVALSGARLDLGEPERALMELDIPELDPDRAFEWSPVLFAARASVLDELGRTEEAATWRHRAEVAADALDAVAGDDVVFVEEVEEIEEPAEEPSELPAGEIEEPIEEVQ